MENEEVIIEVNWEEVKISPKWDTGSYTLGTVIHKGERYDHNTD